MFGVGIVEVVVLLIVLVALVGLVLRATGGRRVPVAVTREWRLVQATRAGGVVLGLLAATGVASLGYNGAGAMLAPAVLGLGVLLGTALGETVVRPAVAAGRRSASLTPRRVVDYLPPVLAPVVGSLVVLAAAVLVLTTITASRDDAGRMRALSCTGDGVGSTRSPYPGSFYSLPLALTLLVVLLVAVLAARQVVRRPRGLAGTDRGDDALRRRSLRVIVAATGVAVCAPLAGVALVAGSALQQLGGALPTACAPGWAGPVGIVLAVLSLAALVVACVCVVQLASGASERRATDAEAAAGADLTPRP